jgi:hypothetical protein
MSKLTPEQKREREKVVKAIKHKPGIKNPYAVATKVAKESK